MNCEACRNEPILGVCASPLGPISLAYGQNCLQNDAEPEWLVIATLDCTGGWSAAADWLKGVRIYRDGEYVLACEALADHVPYPFDEGLPDGL